MEFGMKTQFIFAASLAISLGFAIQANAHHGWGWYEEGQPFQLTGIVESANMGGPHGLLKLRAGNELWDVVLAPPGRNERAGLTNDIIKPGMEVTAYGHKWNDDESRLEMKTERIEVGNTLYNLYPERD
jgi:hypothetical protein